MKLAIALVFTLLVGWGNTQSTDYFIDLRTLEGSTDEELLTVPLAERVGATRPLPVPLAVHGASSLPPAPFELSALSFDRSDYNRGDPFTYEVTVRYLGSAEIKFPVAGKKHLFREGMAGLRHATLSLEFKDSLWNHQVVQLKPLYGSEELPQSLVTLTENQTIRLRDEGRWRLSAVTPPVSPTWLGSVLPFAVLDLVHKNVSYGVSRSAGTVSIHLAPPQ